MGTEKIVGKLGDFITLVSRKNKNLETTKLVGISCSKGILDNPRKASEAYLKTGWIAQRGEFVVDLVNVQHNNHLAVDINRSKEPIVISHIYNVFKISNTLLVGEYLLLLLKNSVMEKRLKYACHGSVRGTLSWDNFTGIPISAPILETQERIVNRYQTISRFIEVKRRINELLERQMRAYFHIMFDDLRDYEIKTFKELFTVIRGGRPLRSNKYLEKRHFCKEGGVPWLQVSDITKSNFKFVNKTEDQLTEEGFKRGHCTLLGGGHLVIVNSASRVTVGKVLITGRQMSFDVHWWALKHNEEIGLPYLFFLLKSHVPEWVRLADSSSTNSGNLKISKLLPLKFKIPLKPLLDKFNSFCEPIFELQKSNEQIIQKLLRLQKCWVESLD